MDSSSAPREVEPARSPTLFCRLRTFFTRRPSLFEQPPAAQPAQAVARWAPNFLEHHDILAPFLHMPAYPINEPAGPASPPEHMVSRQSPVLGSASAPAHLATTPGSRILRRPQRLANRDNTVPFSAQNVSGLQQSPDIPDDADSETGSLIAESDIPVLELGAPIIPVPERDQYSVVREILGRSHAGEDVPLPVDAEP